MGMNCRHRVLGFLATVLLVPTATADTVIRGATVIDGSGKPGFMADVRLQEGRITAIGTLPPREGERVVEAKGLVLAPGFIDAHSHHERGMDADLDVRSAASQGITTAIVGVLRVDTLDRSCGLSD